MAERAPRCNACGYDLRGVTVDPTLGGGTCPECGAPFEPDRPDNTPRIHRDMWLACAAANGASLAVAIVVAAAAVIDPGGSFDVAPFGLVVLGVAVYAPIRARRRAGSYGLSMKERGLANLLLVAAWVLNFGVTFAIWLAVFSLMPEMP